MIIPEHCLIKLYFQKYLNDQDDCILHWAKKIWEEEEQIWGYLTSLSSECEGGILS